MKIRITIQFQELFVSNDSACIKIFLKERTYCHPKINHENTFWKEKNKENNAL